MLGSGGALLTDCTLLSRQPLDNFAQHCLVASEMRETLLHNSREPDESFIDVWMGKNWGLCLTLAAS